MHSLQLHVSCACTIDTSETPAFVCCLKNGVVLELCRTAANQTLALASLQTNGIKEATTKECHEELFAICYPRTLTKTAKPTVADEEQ